MTNKIILFFLSDQATDTFNVQRAGRLDVFCLVGSREQVNCSFLVIGRWEYIHNLSCNKLKPLLTFSFLAFHPHLLVYILVCMHLWRVLSRVCLPQV